MSIKEAESVKNKQDGSFISARLLSVLSRTSTSQLTFLGVVVQGCLSDTSAQLVTYGDHDLDFYARRYFPEAIHTIDIMHVIEKLWKAGECLYPEGSEELKRWVERQKEQLYGGKVALIVAELRRQLERKPRAPPRGIACGRRRSHQLHFFR